MFLPHPRVKVSIVGSLRDREVASSASDQQGSNFEYCVWRTVSSQSSDHPQEVLLAQFSLYVHKGGLKPDSFHFYHAIIHRFSLNALVRTYYYHFGLFTLSLLLFKISYYYFSLNYYLNGHTGRKMTLKRYFTYLLLHVKGLHNYRIF